MNNDLFMWIHRRRCCASEHYLCVDLQKLALQLCLLLLYVTRVVSLFHGGAQATVFIHQLLDLGGDRAAVRAKLLLCSLR